MVPIDVAAPTETLTLKHPITGVVQTVNIVGKGSTFRNVKEQSA